MSDIWVQLNIFVNKYTGVINWYKRPNDNRPLKEEAKETDNSKYTNTCRLLQQWQLIKQYDGLTIQVCYLDGIWSACPWGATNTVLRKKIITMYKALYRIYPSGVLLTSFACACSDVIRIVCKPLSTMKYVSSVPWKQVSNIYKQN